MKMTLLILTAAAFLTTIPTPASTAPAQNYEQTSDRAIAIQGYDYFDANNYHMAWTLFDKAIKLNPNEHSYYYMRAACYGNMGNYQAALADLNKSLNLTTINECKGFCHHDLAIVYSEMGDLNATEFHLSMAAKFGNKKAQDICNQFNIPY